MNTVCVCVYCIQAIFADWCRAHDKHTVYVISTSVSQSVSQQQWTFRFHTYLHTLTQYCVPVCTVRCWCCFCCCCLLKAVLYLCQLWLWLSLAHAHSAPKHSKINQIRRSRVLKYISIRTCTVYALSLLAVRYDTIVHNAILRSFARFSLEWFAFQWLNYM